MEYSAYPDFISKYNLTFNANNGETVKNSSGGAGGIASFYNELSFLPNTTYFNTLILQDGPTGGSAGQNGKANKYTSSGSGSSGNGTSIAGNPPKVNGLTLPSVYNSDFDTITSQGGGYSVIPWIYGSGGGSAPSSWKIDGQNQVPQVREGSTAFSQIMAAFSYKET